MFVEFLRQAAPVGPPWPLSGRWAVGDLTFRHLFWQLMKRLCTTRSPAPEVQVNSERLALIVRIAGGHLAISCLLFFFFSWRGLGDENPIKLQELKNKELVLFFFSPFQNRVGGLPERLRKTKQKPTTGSCIMCRQVRTHTNRTKTAQLGRWIFLSLFFAGA